MRAAAGAVAVAVAAAATVVPAQASEREVWYVSADAAPGGSGSLAKPLGSLAHVAAASGPGDTILVLRATRVLDGGIALKPGQRLVGLDDAAITNTTTRLDGDAVRLADGAVVRGLHIVAPLRGGVYGVDVTGVTVADNHVSGHNAGCTPGFLIPEFNAPTNLPGVGIPISGGLQNGWAGIMVDGSARTGAIAVIKDNVVHHAECGDGIDVRTWGAAQYDVRIENNVVHSLRQGPDFKSLLAIGLQARDRSALSAAVVGNVQRNLGNDDDPNFVVGADSEGVFVNGVGPSTIRAVIERNHYTNEDGVGGFSANGLEMVTMGDGSRASVIVRDSYFSGSPGDVIEEGALGTNARLDMVLERVTAERSTGVGNTYLLPFNNGDCLLAGSLGAGNDVRLTVRDSVLRQCSNNGLSVGSNVVNGTGPTRNISVDVSGTTITGNRGGNLGIRNFTPLGSLSVRVTGSDLAGSSSLGSSYADVAAENWSSIDTSSVSVTGSCLRGGLLALNVVRMHVDARSNWWGSPWGPGLLRTFVLGGSADVRSPLPTKPTYCG